MPEKILVTGGAGFIGSFLCDHFLATGHQVRVLDCLDPQVHPDGKPTYLRPEVEVIVADVRDRDALRRALAGVTVVIHAAAAVGVAQSLYRVQHYVDANAGGTAALLETLIENKQSLARLLVFTSMTGYGEGLYRRPSDGRVLRVPIRSEEDVARHGWEPTDPETHEPLVPVPTPENSEMQARNVYALTKLWQEELALSLGGLYGIPVTCLRLFNVYGPRQSLSNPYTGVLAIFLSRLREGRAPVVYEDGKQTRDFVSVHDVVRAADAAIRSPAADGQVFNVGTGIAREIAEIGRTLARLLGRAIEPEVSGQFRRGDVRHCLADASRIRSALGFTPTVDWEESLSEIIAWSQDVPSSDQFARADEELRRHGLLR